MNELTKALRWARARQPWFGNLWYVGACRRMGVRRGFLNLEALHAWWSP